jgi:hypothetical protein
MIIKAKPPNVRNGIVWYSIAKQFSLDELRDVCMKTVAWNVEYLLSTNHSSSSTSRNHSIHSSSSNSGTSSISNDSSCSHNNNTGNQIDWIRCEFDFIRDLLSTTSVVVSNEYRLYTSITVWLLSKSSDPLRVVYACELLPLIRFSQMLPIQLHHIEQSTFYRSNCDAQIQQLLQRLLYQAYRFHTLAPLKRDSDRPEFLPLTWYLPREYTEMNITYVLSRRIRNIEK